MITVDEALAHVFALARLMPVEAVPLVQAAGRVLAEDVAAARTQPPFPASAMDGYAVPAREAAPGAAFTVIGEAAAGHRFDGAVGPGQAVRIFTGGVVPEGADFVVIQEDVIRQGDRITIKDSLGTGSNIRPAGSDFSAGSVMAAPRVLSPQDVALLAAMNVPGVPVRRKPVVAVIATGDELVLPGEDPGPDQIVASNSFGLAAQLDAVGAAPRLLPIARDTEASLTTIFGMADEADLVVTIGGASVGDHDLVAPVAEALGMERAFYKVLMRPGKPLMAGRLGEAAMLGLPGNPVSALVCGTIFLLPLVRAMLGLGAHPAPRERVPLAVDVPEGGPREHYMRAALTPEGIVPYERQDSALLSVLSKADALLVRPRADAPRAAGTMVDCVRL